MTSLQDEDQKLKFLDSVCTLCRTAKDDGFSQDLDDFCCRYKLGEMIQELLDYMDTVAVQERVMGRVRLLSHLLADPSPVQAGQNEDSGAASGQIQIPVLGRLLGHLFFKSFRKEQTILMVLNSLCSLLTFLSKQKCATQPEVQAELPAYWESEIISLLNVPSSWRVQAFGKYLRRAERTGIVLTTFEILGRSSLLDKQVPMEFLEVAMKSPGLWLMDMLASGDVLENKVCPLDKSLNLLRSSRKAVVPLVLRALVTLSERVETARKMKGLLPKLVEFLWHWSWDISVMAMDTCHNVLEQLKKSEASAIAVKMVQKLWHLFDVIRLIELLGKMVWRDTKAMRRNSWEALVQLVFHMSDQAPSVAKASKEAILATAELLKWRELKHLEEKWV
ncbi:hypothetical protein DUI87_25081 [Hirundo rustica rustica]|uniref:Maestro/Maestro-like HEAT-repeats domain-containing protein n=1 Tax=Hirundo rustica rustica TaxID=333673 RepID=A0A3M0JHG8_HIRRU|nr:hypothetical protein DUI87_25081 [Hirundo rustica rustica]